MDGPGCDVATARQPHDRLLDGDVDHAGRGDRGRGRKGDEGDLTVRDAEQRPPDLFGGDNAEEVEEVEKEIKD